MTVDLTYGSFRAAADTHGGELISFRDGEGTEYLWSGDGAYWSGRNPNLFPIVGSLKDGAVRFRGRVYHMSRHGFARDREFTVAERGSDYVVMELREDADTLSRYPYPFRFQVRHQLTADGFYTQFAVMNTGSEPMPFCVGGHTAYRCPIRSGERFEDYRLVFDEREDADVIPLSPDGVLSGTKREPLLRNEDTIALRHDIFDRADTLVFDGLRSAGVSLVHGGTGRGLHVAFGDFPMLGVWTMPGKAAPYICIEPWQGCAAMDNESGAFEDKPHCVVLAPGAEKTLRYTVRLL